MKYIIITLVFVGFGSPVAAGEPGAPRLPLLSLATPAEVDAAEAEVMEWVREIQERTCPRPVLRGATVAGASADAIVAIVEGTGVTKACVEYMSEHSHAFVPESWEAFFDTGEGIPERAQEGLFVPCEALAGQVAGAVAHGDGCSPWRPGVRGNPSFIPLLRLTKVAVVMGRAGYTQGSAVELAHGALDWLRLYQDVYRGGGTLIAAMVSAAAVEIQVRWLRWILTQGHLDAAAMREIVDELGILLDTDPSIGLVLQADGLWSALQLALPLRHGPDWVPPGGWDVDRVDAPMGSVIGTERVLDKVTETWVLLRMTLDDLEDRRAACPRDANSRVCADGLRQLSQKYAAHREVNVAVRIIRVMAATDPRVALRDWIVEILSEIATPFFVKYVEKDAFKTLLLAHLRVHAEFLRIHRKTGQCPTQEQLTGDRWDEIARDPVFGGRVEVLPGEEKGQWILRPSGRFEAASITDAWAQEYRFNCPQK